MVTSPQACTVRQAIAALQDLAYEGYADSPLVVLAGPHDERLVYVAAIDEACGAGFGDGYVWIDVYNTDHVKECERQRIERQHSNAS